MDCTTLGILGWGESASTEVQVTGGGIPSRQGGSSGEEGILALEEAKQPAVRDGLLDDLLDLLGQDGGQEESRVRDISPIFIYPPCPLGSKWSNQPHPLLRTFPGASLSPYPPGLAPDHLPSWFALLAWATKGKGLCLGASCLCACSILSHLISPIPHLPNPAHALPLNSRLIYATAS